MAFWLELFSWFSSNYGIFQHAVFQLLFSVDQKEEENKKTTLSERAAEKNKPNSQVQNVFFSYGNAQSENYFGGCEDFLLFEHSLCYL